MKISAHNLNSDHKPITTVLKKRVNNSELQLAHNKIFDLERKSNKNALLIAELRIGHAEYESMIDELKNTIENLILESESKNSEIEKLCNKMKYLKNDLISKENDINSMQAENVDLTKMNDTGMKAQLNNFELIAQISAYEDDFRKFKIQYKKMKEQNIEKDEKIKNLEKIIEEQEERSKGGKEWRVEQKNASVSEETNN